MTTMRTCVPLAVAAALAGAIVGSVPTAASAAVAPNDRATAVWAQAQPAMPFTVYQPTVSPGPVRTAFFAGHPAYCEKGALAVTATYGRATSGPMLELGEFATHPCEDGPAPMAPAATFTFRGAKVVILGDCPRPQATQCRKATDADVRRAGYASFTLPGTDGRTVRTAVTVDSTGLGIAALTAFIRGLKPVAASLGSRHCLAGDLFALVPAGTMLATSRCGTVAGVEYAAARWQSTTTPARGNVFAVYRSDAWVVVPEAVVCAVPALPSPIRAFCGGGLPNDGGFPGSWQ